MSVMPNSLKKKQKNKTNTKPKPYRELGILSPADSALSAVPCAALRRAPSRLIPPIGRSSALLALPVVAGGLGE